MKKNLYRLAVVLLTLTLLGIGGYLLWKELDYRRGAEDYAAAADVAGLDQSREDARDEVVQAPEDPFAAALAGTDLDALKELNPDVLGWIAIPDTELSYPLLQGEDNNWYLNHTWMGERSAVGAIFLECQCAPDFSGFNTIIYGHRMNNHSMFGTLREYKQQDFWSQHPAVYIVDSASVRRYEIFAAGEASVREVVYRLDIECSGLQQEFIDYCLEQSVIDTGVVPTAEDQVITLSTCTGRGYATRWVVQAVLREEFPLSPSAPSAEGGGPQLR